MKPTAQFLPIFLVALFAIGCDRGSGLTSPDDWKAYKSDSGAMSAKFPEEPERVERKSPSEIGTLNFRIMTWSSRNGALQAGEMKIPVPPSQYDARKGLQGALESAASETKSKILLDEDITKLDMPGKRYLLEMTKRAGAYCSAVSLVDQNVPCLYLVQAVGTKKFVESDEAKAFLDSLKVTPSKTVDFKKKSRSKKKATSKK